MFLRSLCFSRLSVALSQAVEEIVVQDSLRSSTADLISLQNSRRISAMRSAGLKAEGQHAGQIKEARYNEGSMKVIKCVCIHVAQEVSSSGPEFFAQERGTKEGMGSA